MVRLPFVFLLLAAALSSAAAVPTTTPSPLVITPAQVSAPVVPGAQSLWFHVHATDRRSWVVVEFLQDAEADGWVHLPRLAQYEAPSTLWTVVDMTSGRLMAGEPTGTVPRQSAFPPKAFLRDSAGHYSNLIIDISEMPSSYELYELLWVRPGTGAWTLTTADSDRLTDLDRARNDLLVLNASAFLPEGPAPTPPGFVAGDLLVGIDSAAYYWFGDVVDTHLSEAGGPGVLSVYGFTNVGEKSGTATFTVLRSDGAEGSVSVDYATSDGTAVSGVHYQAAAGTLVFGPGEIVKTVEIPIIDDAVYSGPKNSFSLNFTNTAGAAIAGPASFLYNIYEDDPKPTLTVHGGVTVSEGGSGTYDVALQVRLTGATRLPASGTWTVSPEVPGVSNGAPLTFDPGETEKSITFRYAGDTVPGADRDYYVSMTGLQNADPGPAARVTVVDDDYATLTVSDAMVKENDGSVYVQLTLNAAPARNVTLKYTTVDGTATAGNDYEPRSGTLSFSPSQTSNSVMIPIHADLLLNEPDETFDLVISDVSGAIVADGGARVTIVNQEPPAPFVSIPYGWTGSESTDATFEVRLTAVTYKDVSVVATTRATGTTATAGVDFVAKTETLRIPAGQLSTTFVVDVIDDAVREGTELFAVDLSGEVNARPSSYPFGFGSILDNDASGSPPSATIDDATIVEGHSGAKNLLVRVRLASLPETQVTIDYSTADGTAIAGSDYQDRNGTLTFTSNDLEKVIVIPVFGDAEVEDDETFTVKLTSASGAVLVKSNATCTITNDDRTPVPPPVPSIRITGASAPEGHTGFSSLQVRVELSSPAPAALSVQYATGGGTGTVGTDYAATSGRLTFAIGESMKTISVPVAGDTTYEPDETFEMRLTEPQGATIEVSTALCTILNDDRPPSRRRRSARS